MIGAFIYARLSSKRLPRKALLPLGANSVIETVINNTKNDNIYKTFLLTSDEVEDDDLALIGRQLGIEVFRDSLTNVALRTLNCIKKYNINTFFRINGDSPLINNDFYEKCLSTYRLGDFEILHNVNPRTFPYGYSIEIINSSVFVNNYNNFRESDFEHITQYFYRNKEKFKIKSIQNNLNYSDLQFTVDDESSYKKLSSLFLKHPNINRFDLIQKINSYIND
jgi:spore coat polysaccharide biosynthesis protein SpsF